jgi:cyanophycinase
MAGKSSLFRRNEFHFLDLLGGPNRLGTIGHDRRFLVYSNRLRGSHMNSALLRLPLLGAILLIASVGQFPATDARAEDNPFGFPEPTNPRRPGAVMLHGGGGGVQPYVRQEFLRLAGGKAARVVLLPSDEEQREPAETLAAYEDRLGRAGVYGQWRQLCRDNQARFQFLHWQSPEDPDHSRFFAALDEATGLWLPANDQEWVIGRFAGDPLKPTRFQIALRNLIARGGVVGASGGGMASLAETVIAGDADEEPSGWTRARLAFGLGLFQGTLLDQNFNIWSGRVERMTDALRNGPQLDRVARRPGVQRRTIGIGVDRQTVAVVSGNTIRALGESHVHVFVQSNGGRTLAWHRLSAGDRPLVLTTGPAWQHGRPPAAKPAGADNPLGVPPGRGIVVLHGGGSTAEMYDLFPRLSGKLRPTLVHCPSASGDYRRMSDDELLACDLTRLWKTDAVAGLRFINADKPARAEQSAFCGLLDTADALWIMGGDQRNLTTLYVNPIQPTLFQKKVRAMVERGGVVGGSSAGCAAMSDVMIVGNVADDGRSPARAELARGLGVLANCLAEQHFDARGGRIERFAELLRDKQQLANISPGCNPAQMVGLAVDESTALIVRGNRLSVAGKNKAHVFLKAAAFDTLIWHSLAAGDIGVACTAADGSHQLHFEEWNAAD